MLVDCPKAMARANGALNDVTQKTIAATTNPITAARYAVVNSSVERCCRKLWFLSEGNNDDDDDRGDARIVPVGTVRTWLTNRPLFPDRAHDTNKKPTHTL